MYVKRTSSRNSGWGVILRWTREDAVADWWYNLYVTGVQHPGAWSGFTLRVGRDHGRYLDLQVKTGVVRDVLHAVCVTQGYQIPSNAEFERVGGPTGIDGFATFWKLAQAARRTRDEGAGSALVDWLCERNVPLPFECGLTELLQEGVPQVRKVWAARQAEQLVNAEFDAVRDQRVAAV